MSQREEVTADFYARRLAGKESLKRSHLQRRAQVAVKALEKNGFSARYVEDRTKAREEILQLIPPSSTVGVGGSMTIRELGILEHLAGKGHIIFDHWKPGLSQEELMAVRRAQLTSDVFLTSVNALTLKGEMVSIDGAGNRTSAMTFGPKKVIIAVGMNKIVQDIPAAFRRIKDIAVPNTIGGSGTALACVETGVCIDCNSPVRACRVTLILERKPAFTDTIVFVIGEELGF